MTIHTYCNVAILPVWSLRIFQHSYNNSSNQRDWVLLTRVFTLSVPFLSATEEARIKETISRRETISRHSRTTFFFFFFFLNLTCCRWASSLPSRLWSLRIFPALPGSRLTIFFYRDASSALLQLVSQWLNFTYSRSHSFRYERKNTKSYFGKNRTHDFRTSRCAGYLLDHSGEETVDVYVTY